MKKILSLLATFLPAVILAQTQATAPLSRDIDGILDWVIRLSAKILPILILVSVVLFIFGIVKRFFLAGKDGVDRGEASKFILWGIVALAVMGSVWGLVNALRNSFDLDNQAIQAPQLPPQLR